MQFSMKTLAVTAVLALSPLSAFAEGAGGGYGGGNTNLNGNSNTNTNTNLNGNSNTNNNETNVGVVTGSQSTSGAAAGARSNANVTVKGSAASAQAMTSVCGKALGLQALEFGISGSRPDMNCVMMEHLPGLMASGIFTKSEAKSIALAAWGGNFTVEQPDGSRLVAKRGKVMVEAAPAAKATGATVQVVSATSSKVTIKVGGTKYHITGDNLAAWNANRKLNLGGTIIRKSDVQS